MPKRVATRLTTSYLQLLVHIVKYLQSKVKRKKEHEYETISSGQQFYLRFFFFFVLIDVPSFRDSTSVSANDISVTVYRINIADARDTYVISVKRNLLDLLERNLYLCRPFCLRNIRRRSVHLDHLYPYR